MRWMARGFLRPFQDCLSFEMMYLLFLLMGVFKGAEGLREMNSAMDLTLLATLTGIFLAAPTLVRNGLSTARSGRRFLFLSSALLAWAFLSYTLGPQGEVATL